MENNFSLPIGEREIILQIGIFEKEEFEHIIKPMPVISRLALIEYLGQIQDILREDTIIETQRFGEDEENED